MTQQRSSTTHNVRVVMNGVTGRMGTNQHLIRSIIAIRKEGGVLCADGDRIMPSPILVGRNKDKLLELARGNGLDDSCISLDLDEALADKDATIYFDAQTTGRRVDAVKKALSAGKHVYCEKPTATSTEEAYDLYKFAKASGLKHGVVQDKLWLPGLVKLKSLLDTGFFGDVLSVKGDFGYWVFTGMGPVPPQRPSWNYRKEDDGGIISDMVSLTSKTMLTHRYVTGVMSSTISLVLSSLSHASAQRTSPSARMSRVKCTSAQRTTRATRHSSFRTALLSISTLHGSHDLAGTTSSLFK